jgi:zinc protease
VAGNALFASAYREHPYRAPVLGTPESVSTFNRERVRAFFERWYTAEHLAVVAVGSFELDELARAVRAACGDWGRGAARRARAVEPPQSELRSALLRRPFERACLELGWPTVPLAHGDTPYLDLLAFVLGEGDSSRLVRRVQERDAVVDRVDASSYTPLDPGLFGSSADLDPERSEAAIEALVREVEWLRREPVSAAELEKARTNFLASQHFERESVSGQARKLAIFQLLMGDYRAEETYLAAIRSATPADLLRVAQRYLASERLNVSAVLPQQGAPGLDHAAVERAVARGGERIRSMFAAPVRQAPSASQTASAARAGSTSPSPAAELHSYRLPNGAELHVDARREVPVAAVRAAFVGGQLAEDEKNAGLSHFLTSMWLRGTQARSAAELARAIESIAAEIDGFSGRSSLGLWLEAPSAELEGALELFAEILLEPTFASDELERERRETRAAIARREDRLAARAFDLFAANHWKAHPFRLPLVGTDRSVAHFTREDLVAQQTRLIRAGNLALAVSGDVDPDWVAERLTVRLAGLEASPFEPPAPEEEPAPREIREAELRKDRAQAHLVIGFRGLTVHDPDRYALEIIAQLLAGQGGRLFLELRDRQSLAYAVNAMNVEGLAPGFLALYIASAPEKFETARRGLLDELARLLESAPPEHEVERARRYLIGSHAIDQQRSAARAAHVALDARYGLGAEASWRYPEQIAAVTRHDVVRVAQRVIDLEAYTLAVIRP